MPDQGFTFGGTSGATYGQASGGSLGADTPRAVQSLTVTQGQQGELDLSWAANDTASEYAVYRATSSGSSTSDYTAVATVAAPTTSYTDTGLDDGVEYHYRVTARNHRGESDLSPEDSAVTSLPAPTDVQVSSVTATSADISWTDNTDDETGYRVLISTDGGSSWTNASGNLAPDTTSYALSGLRNGEQYKATVEAFTADAATRDTSQPTFQTDLPDEDQPLLGNGVEDEVAVDRESAVSNYGDVRIQIRETGQSSWDSNATGFAEFIGDHSTLAMEFVGREDGERYEVRARTETEHVSGAWTDPVAITTKFPGASSLSISNVGETSADYDWTDNSDNEDGFRLQYRKLYDDGSVGAWQTGETVGANTTSGSIDTLQPGRDYDLRVLAYTEHASAGSNVETASTTAVDIRQRRVPSSGWYVEIDHPDRAEPLTPSIIEDDCQVQQQANGLPRLTIPVPRDESWQAEAFEDAPLRAWKDGRPQPVDTLVDVEVSERRTTLIAEGGKELKQRLQKSVQFADVDDTVRDLLSAVSYTTNVDDPAASTDEILMQDVDSSTELEDILPSYPFAADNPRVIRSDGALDTHQSALFLRGEDYDSTSGWEEFFGDQFENGSAVRALGVNNSIEWTFDVGYTIPASEAGFQFRIQYFGDTHPGFEIRRGGSSGEVLATISADTGLTNQPMPRWLSLGASTSTDLSGSDSIYINITEAASDDSYLYVDAVAVFDKRYTLTVSQDDLSNGGRLSWPNLHPDSIQTETADAQALNQVVGGRLSVTMSSTANNQQLELSNDQGGSWPISASNATAVDGSFPSDSGQIRARFTQSYSDSGSGPVKWDAGQPIDAYELYADQEDVPVLIDRAFDDRGSNILTTIAEDKNALWELRVDEDYNFSVEWTWPGQRTSDEDSDIVSYNVSKSTGDIVEKAVIKGGRQTRTGETVTSAHDTWVSLDYDDLIEGVEAVRDPSTGQQFARGDDYEIDYLEGRIKVLSTGAMSDATDYAVDYDYKPQASYTKAGVDDPKTIVRHVPSIHSEQTARQLAYYLVRDYGDPVYSASITIPRQAVGWSVIDEIDPDRVPTAGKRLQIRDIQTAPQQIVIQAETQQGLAETLEQYRQRLGQTESKV